jgi:hypothetical protein
MANTDTKPMPKRPIFVKSPLLRRREQPRQPGVDDLPRHPLAGVRHLDHHQPAARLVLDADVDLLAARVDRVLDQLPQEGPRVRELVHEPLERVAHAADVRGLRRHRSPGIVPLLRGRSRTRELAPGDVRAARVRAEGSPSGSGAGS